MQFTHFAITDNVELPFYSQKKPLVVYNKFVIKSLVKRISYINLKTLNEDSFNEYLSLYNCFNWRVEIAQKEGYKCVYYQTMSDTRFALAIKFCESKVDHSIFVISIPSSRAYPGRNHYDLAAAILKMKVVKEAFLFS